MLTEESCDVSLAYAFACRALILSKKISPRAFAETSKKGQEAGEVGIEGLTIENPAEASHLTLCSTICPDLSQCLSSKYIQQAPPKKNST